MMRMLCGEGMAEWSICPEECENVSFWPSRDAAVTQCELYISAFFLLEIKMDSFGRWFAIITTGHYTQAAEMDAELVYMYQ